MGKDKKNNEEKDMNLSGNEEEKAEVKDEQQKSLNDDDNFENEDFQEDSIVKALSEKEAEIQSLKELLQRRQADFENYKKRVLRQNEELKKYALKDLALDIIAINDDMIRAIDSSKDVDSNYESAYSSFVDGVSMISTRIEEVLAKYGIEQIDAEECEFDPNYHEAVEIESREDLDQDKVSHVYQKGFKIDDLVIRSCKVRVAKAVKAAGESDSSGKGEENDSGNTGNTSEHVSENLN